MRLSRFDLNLLVVFEAMMEERSVSRAADRLALSQPAASNALGRLRALLGDPLFVRTPSGMEPTARALQLATPVRRALEDFAQALEPADFSPATASRVFRLALNNHAALVLAAPILRACAIEAPGIRLDIRPSGTLAVDDLLDRGDLDFVITANPLDRQRFASRVLVEDGYQLVMRAGHPLAGVALSLVDFSQAARVDVSSSGEDMSFVSQALAAAGLPDVKMGAVPYLALPTLLRDTELVAVVRKQIAQVLARSGEIVSSALPLPDRRVATVLSWHQRHSGHTAHLWLADLMTRIASPVG
ncbi:MAG: LysR family transcriptional regulator [Sphingomonadales bacterium]|nr:LysR family transcriptional regulator [Sphingomonadales bacterium]MDE2168508.1 LysR family transcriptional regulator [Sphingomonadales bacterium]